ncbi:protein farnesyltransferase alpha subunit,putative [Schistosoma mansoni]|uniref:protein farnesyltransferase alpha subunit,putative n=1 Tax=Schistosoma mansoni TaxID=6183 RepID=UPI00022C84CE|nr:protein farnesyltransferase alpha subunit,putative [Schistosoma mansoni]|eukprot:XP_018644996.1 protein farnesyltransferase alpha subunit,putative [Schistosoma mansoni]
MDIKTITDYKLCSELRITRNFRIKTTETIPTELSNSRRKNLIRMSTREKYVFYKDRQEWDDVSPIPQDDGGRNIVNIAYSEEFVDAHDYFRAALMKDERSERTLSLTSDILLFNPANYTAWEYRRRIIEEISSDLNGELRFVGELIEDYSKNYQVSALIANNIIVLITL